MRASRKKRQKPGWCSASGLHQADLVDTLTVTTNITCSFRVCVRTFCRAQVVSSVFYNTELLRNIRTPDRGLQVLLLLLPLLLLLV
jgi:hypothetical protein